MVSVTGFVGECVCVTCRSAEGASGDATVNGCDVALAVTEPAFAAAVRVNPAPSALTCSSGKVAMPSSPLVAILPVNTAPTGLFASASVTTIPGRAAPELSNTRTRTTGVIGWPSTAPTGCCRKNRLDPLGVTIGGSVTPAAAASLGTACDDTPGVT